MRTRFRSSARVKNRAYRSASHHVATAKCAFASCMRRARDTAELLPIRLHERPHRDADHVVDALLRGRGREVEQHRLEGRRRGTIRGTAPATISQSSTRSRARRPRPAPADRPTACRCRPPGRSRRTGGRSPACGRRSRSRCGSARSSGWHRKCANALPSRVSTRRDVVIGRVELEDALGLGGTAPRRSPRTASSLLLK